MTKSGKKLSLFSGMVHNVCTFHIWHLDVVVEHVVGAWLGGPVGSAHGGAQLGVVVADPLQGAWAESYQG